MVELTRVRRIAALGLALCALGLQQLALAQTSKPKDDELDALDLKAEPAKPEAAPKAKPSGSKLLLEAALGSVQQRYGLGDETTYRAALDWRYSARLSAAWRVAVSDRLDHIKPSDGDRTINTLREAYVGWQGEGASTSVEFGRINLRNGPGYGYNPSDFFRDGSLRTTTTLDPVALRDARMGSVALRAQQLWSGGSVSLVVSPKLEDQPSAKGFNLDLGSSNHHTRTQLGLSQDLMQGVSAQLLLFKQSDESTKLGGNLTALIGESAVFHLEAAHGREPALVDRAIPPAGAPMRVTGTRLATGITAVLPASTSLTLEWQRNPFALSRGQWDALAAAGGVLPLEAYLQQADRRQELASRQGFLIYLSKKGLGVKGLDLTAFVQIDTDDHSRLWWAELRQQLGNFELALQLQQTSGGATSQFGVLPLRRSAQVVFNWRL